MRLVAAALLCAGAGCAPERYLRTAPLVGAAAQEPRTAPPASPPAPDYAGLVGTYCVTCHNDRLKTGGLSLQSLELSSVPEHADVWEKVARKLRSGEMPPSTARSRPDAQLAVAFAGYLEATLDRAAVAHPNPGRAPVHRLNRAEYSNAVRDLLAVDVRPGEWLPVDDSGYGFDNIAAVLSTSPALLDRYVGRARGAACRRRSDDEAGRGDLRREARSEQRQPQRATERGPAVRLPRRHDGRALFPARCRIRLQDSLHRGAGRRRRNSDRSVPGAGRGESRTPHGRCDVAAREPEAGKRYTRWRRRWRGRTRRSSDSRPVDPPAAPA
jgi:hypothetical protein